MARTISKGSTTLSNPVKFAKSKHGHSRIQNKNLSAEEFIVVTTGRTVKFSPAKTQLGKRRIRTAVREVVSGIRRKNNS